MKWVRGNVMGKSYKKTPVIKENGESKKKMKTIANKAVRRKMKDAFLSVFFNLNYDLSQNFIASSKCFDQERSL